MTILSLALKEQMNIWTGLSGLVDTDQLDRFDILAHNAMIVRARCCIDGRRCERRPGAEEG